MRRRDLIRTGILAGAAGVMPWRGSFPAPATRPRDFGPARNIIFFVYDGMGYNDLATTRYFAQRHQDGRRLALEAALEEGATGSMSTHSLISVVTDSAAASAVWAVGRKVVNGAISMYPDGRELTTIMSLAREAGRATGLITTTRITHATPAAWVARVPHRDMEDEIAAQYLDFAPDVLLGGGAVHFDRFEREDGRDLAAEFQAAGYDVLLTPEDLAATNASRLLGIFAQQHLPYEIDRRFQDAVTPSLADMVRKGLDVLSGAEGGFVVQIEAGRVDHANHGNDPGALVWDMLAADEALGVVRDFVAANPDTLLIVTSDHATGGGTVYGVGPLYNYSSIAFDRIARRRASHDHLLATLGEAPEIGEVTAAVGELLGARISEEYAARMLAFLSDEDRMGHRFAHALDSTINQVVTAGVEDDLPLNINYSTAAHTACPVPLAVLGAGVEPAQLGLVDNTELFGWMLEALGVRYENPLLTEEEALPMLSAIQRGRVRQGGKEPVHT